jgi:pilus assembly protein CpaC
MRVLILISLVTILLFSNFLTQAVSLPPDLQSEEEVELIVGEIQTVKAYSPTRVAVTDPTIADIDKVEGNDILLSAKKAGNTTLNIWDTYGERTLQIRVYAEELDSLKNRLKKLLANFAINNLTFKTSKEEGKVILSGEILSDSEKQLKDVLSPFSNKIINLINTIDETAVVQIDVQVLELTKSATEELGVTWLTALQVREEPYKDSSTSTTSGVTTTLNKLGSFSDIFRISQWSRDAITAKLNMLVNEGKGKVLSRPKLVCLSGKEAEFLVGGEIPIVTTTTSSGGNVSTNVEFRKYGVNLKIKPVVKDNEIDTTINTEVSDVDWGNAVTVSGTKIPAFASRSASTQVYLKDGQTIFLAGLIKNKDSTNISGVPFLKDVPFLGAIFRSKSLQKSDTELVISLTPTIVSMPKKPTSVGSAALEKVPQIDIALPATNEEDEALIEDYADISEMPQTSQGQPQDAVASYARGVQEKIAQAIIFPEEAKKYKWQGVVRLELIILSDGSLTEAVVKESSGHDVLDVSALSAAKVQAPYLAFPPDVTSQMLSIDVPVVYSLDSPK